MNKNLLIISLLICSLNSSAQAPYAEVYYDNSNQIQGYAVTKGINGGYVIAGSNNSGGLVLKQDDSGNRQWTKYYNATNGFQSSFFNSVCKTNDSCYFVSGKFLNQSTGRIEAYCAKIDSAGDTLWTRGFNTTGGSELFSAMQTSDNGYIMSGSIYTGSNPYYKAYIIKLDSTGSLQWAESVAPGNQYNYGYSVKELPDSGYLFIGDLQGASPTDEEAFVIKFSHTGSIQWGKKYKRAVASSYGSGIDVEVLNDGLMCYLSIDGYAVFMKTDFNGAVLWAKTISGLGNPFGGAVESKIHKTSDNGFAFTNGYGIGQGWGSVVGKVDSSANVVWISNPMMGVMEMIEASDSGYFIIGNGPLNGVIIHPEDDITTAPFIQQIGVIKTDSLGVGDGCIYSTTNSSNVENITVTTLSLTTTTAGTPAHFNSTIVNAPLTTESGCVAIGGGIKEISGSFSFSVYPNPAHSSFTISIYENQKMENADLKIFDVTGREVYEQKINSKLQTLNTKLNAGIYFVKVSDGEKEVVQKLIIE